MNTTKYRKNSIEATIDAILPAWERFDVIAHELWGDGEGGWSVNDSWHLARGCDREEAVSHLTSRWHVFKANYAPRAAIKNLEDANYCGEEFPSLLEVDGIAFAEVRKSEE